MKMDEQPVQTTAATATATTPAATTAAPPADGRLVKSLVPENGAAWNVKQGFSAGDKVYTDRDFTYYSIPEMFKGAELIQTNCDGKFTESDQAQFIAAKNMTVYAAVDSRVESIPNWLAEWQKTSIRMTASNDVIFEVYSRCVRAGEKVTLGTNGQSSYCVNYTALAAEHLGDANKDGRFNVSDLVTMQKYLLGAGELSDWQFADMDSDGRVDTFDLVLMRKLIVGTDFAPAPAMPEKATTSTTMTTVAAQRLYPFG